jgi:hypothetical protein
MKGAARTKLEDLLQKVARHLPHGQRWNTSRAARRQNAFSLVMSFNILIEFADAFDFTGAEFWQQTTHLRA